MTNEINEAMGRSYDVPDDLDEADLMAELDALEEDLATEGPAAEGGVPSYLQVGRPGWLAGRLGGWRWRGAGRRGVGSVPCLQLGPAVLRSCCPPPPPLSPPPALLWPEACAR
jgi:hypothetical protein